MIDLNKVLNSSKMWIFTESPNIISPWTKTTPDVWNELLFAKTGAVVRCMSCSLPVAAKYRHLMFTLHLSHLTHWTRADFGSAAVVWCISKTMPSCHSFGSPQIADNSENKSILEKKKNSFTHRAKPKSHLRAKQKKKTWNWVFYFLLRHKTQQENKCFEWMPKYLQFALISNTGRANVSNCAMN